MIILLIELDFLSFTTKKMLHFVFPEHYNLLLVQYSIHKTTWADNKLKESFP